MDHPYDPVQVFLRSVGRWPDRPALRCEGQEWSYAQLDRLSRGVAAWCAVNTPAGGRVALFGRKRVLAYAGILGILRAGRSYVPLHPDHPPARWRSMLDRAEVRSAVVGEDDNASLTGVAGVACCDERAMGTNAPWGDDVPGTGTCVMFTSGSTGVPKGIPVGRAQVAAYLEHMLGAFPFSPEDRFTQFFALSFDLSMHDLFVCWGAGACLCVPADDGPLRAAAYVREEDVTVWFSVPSQAAVMERMGALRPGALPSIRRTFFCGEALRTGTARAWMGAAPNGPLVNLYGPTETTIAITSHLLEEPPEGPEGIVPIGKPFPGHQVRVLSDAGPSDPGEGELLLNGPQVNTGYLGDVDATSRAFLRADGDVSLWYRTGDRARIAPDGTIHFLGRVDDQVKLNGHRVEPAEVDAVLVPLLKGGSAATVPVEHDGTVRLATFIDVPMDTEDLFRALRTRLPHYMLPERIIVLDALPYGPHGKVDKRALTAQAAHG